MDDWEEEKTVVGDKAMAQKLLAGATGRDQANGDRILEHGLHLWFSGYINAFRLLKQCYVELERPPEHPIRTIDDAWDRLPDTVMYDWYQGDWSPMHVTFPETPGLPWDEVPVPHLWDIVAGVLEVAIRQRCGRFHRVDRALGHAQRLLQSLGDPSIGTAGFADP